MKVQPVDAARGIVPVDEPTLLRRVLDRDAHAWRELMRRYHEPLREVVREATNAIHPLSDADIDDVLGDFWLHVIEDDMRRLRAFNPARGAALLTWMAIHVSQIAYQRVLRLRSQPNTVSIDEIGEVADSRPPPRVAFRPPRLMRVEEVAERWDLNVKTVYAMIERGELVSRRCGRLIRVPRHVVESFEQASVAPGGKKPCR